MVRSIGRDELRQRLQENPGRVILLDVRERSDYEAEHIKGAISIPMHELTMRTEKEFPKDAEIIVYCGGFECTASTNAADALSESGFENVLNYEGGIRDWKTAGFMTEGVGRQKAA